MTTQCHPYEHKKRNSQGEYIEFRHSAESFLAALALTHRVVAEVVTSSLDFTTLAPRLLRPPAQCIECNFAGDIAIYHPYKNYIRIFLFLF